MDDIHASREIIARFDHPHPTDIAAIDLEQNHGVVSARLRALCESLEDDRVCLEDFVIQLDNLVLCATTLASKMKHRFGDDAPSAEYVRSAESIGHVTISSLKSMKKPLLDHFENSRDFASAIAPNLSTVGSALEMWANLMDGREATLNADAWPRAPITKPLQRNFVAHVSAVFGGIVATFVAGAVLGRRCK